MKVLYISKALVVGAYQSKLEELARIDNIELVAVVPPGWREPGVGMLPLEQRHVGGYKLHVLPLRLNGHHHLFTFAGLERVVAEERPDVLHADEESFNLATVQAIRAGVRAGARCCFYNWANIDRRYPPPFSWFERYSFRHSAHAIAGNREAQAIIRRHGYTGPITVLPQFGVDPEFFSPAEQTPPWRPFVVGFFGRLLQRKGVLDLLDALAMLPSDIHLLLVGQGDLEPEVRARSSAPPLTGRVELVPWVPSAEVPAQLRRLHALALPSRTTPRWKEQFGRVLVEAMACGVPVIGSDSGEIPHVIGDAGLIFPEGDAPALADRIRCLAGDEHLWQELRQRGRRRVLEHYTQRSLAAAYADIYRSMLIK
ncbi:MAG: glycosyl transferase family 1 [Herpetosiphonaceae bacterium]|nr:MAG: glycosyl transferase family 1 [Herpetosiphonaceae bacterium]